MTNLVNHGLQLLDEFVLQKNDSSLESKIDRARDIINNIHKLTLFCQTCEWTQCIGLGTYGTVFVCTFHPPNKNMMAQKAVVKLFRLFTGTNQDIMNKVDPTHADVITEWKTQYKFSPYAPELYTFEISNNYAAIVMEYVDQTLADMLHNTRRPSQRYKDWVNTNIQELFQFLNKQKYTHGDLAPFNIGIVTRTINDDKYERIICLDFDRASTCSIHYTPSIDLLGLLVDVRYPEFTEGNYVSYVSTISKVVEKAIMTSYDKTFGRPLPVYNKRQLICEYYKHYSAYNDTTSLGKPLDIAIKNENCDDA